MKCNELNFLNEEVEEDVSRFNNYLSELLGLKNHINI